jgi:hypothetical protein
MLARAKEHVALVEKHVGAIDKIVSDEAVATQAEFEQAMSASASCSSALMLAWWCCWWCR